MKKIFIFVASLLILSSKAINEKSAITIAYIHEALYQVRIYTNGVFWQDIPTNKIRITIGAGQSFNSTNDPAAFWATNLYTFTTYAPSHGTYLITLAMVENGLEGEQSLPITQTFKIFQPQNLNLKEK